MIIQINFNVCRCFLGVKPVLIISDPHIVKQVLVRDFHKFIDRPSFVNTEDQLYNSNLLAVRGEKWKKIRSLISPSFTSGKIKYMRSMIKQSVEDLLDNISDKTVNGMNELDMKDLFGGLTMEVIAKCAFATNTNSSQEPNHPFIKNAKKLMDFKSLNIIPALMFPKWLNDLLGIHSIFDKQVHNYFINQCKHIINERKRLENNIEKNDFLQLLINAEDTDGNYRDVDDKLDSHHLNEGISNRSILSMIDHVH